MSTGQVNIAEFLLGQFANEDPVFAADNVPFVAPGYDNAWKFYQAQKPVLEKKLQGRGLKLLYAVAWPGQGIYTKEPLKTVADLKGAKMRTYSPLTSRLAELLGASPSVQVQVTDVPQMFATGAMTSHGHLVGHRHRDQGVGVRQELLQDQRLESEERGGREPARLQRAAEGRSRTALLKAAAAAEPRGWEMSKAREKEGDETLAKNGMTVPPSPSCEGGALQDRRADGRRVGRSPGADGQAILKAYQQIGEAGVSTLPPPL